MTWAKYVMVWTTRDEPKTADTESVEGQIDLPKVVSALLLPCIIHLVL